VQTQILKVLVTQLVVLLLCVCLALIFASSYHNALWVFIGGIVALLATGAQALFFRLFRWDHGGVVKLLLVAEFAKVLIVVLCLTVLFRFFSDVRPLWVLLGLGVTLFSSMISLIF
jgi:hypothetical protein